MDVPQLYAEIDNGTFAIQPRGIRNQPYGRITDSLPTNRSSTPHLYASPSFTSDFSKPSTDSYLRGHVVPGSGNASSMPCSDTRQGVYLCPLLPVWKCE